MTRIAKLNRIILLACSFPICHSAYSDPKSISITDPRPIAKAVEALEGIYGWPITYEDPPFVHETEVTDVTDKVRRDQDIDANSPFGREADIPDKVRRDQKIVHRNKVLVPKERTISLRYDDMYSPSSRTLPSGSSTGGARHSVKHEWAALAQAVRNVLQENAASRGLGEEMFTVFEDSQLRLFHVVPTHFINREGKVQQLSPLLDTVVNILPKQRTALDLINEICQSLSRITGHKVFVGIAPSFGLQQHTTTLVDSATARSLLSRLLGEIGVPLSWQLFYDPGLEWYVLNIHRVTKATKR